jgi:hypothetical protein
MQTVALTLTDQVQDYLESQAKKHGKATPQDYLQSVLDELAIRVKEKKELEASLLEAIRSPHVVGDAAFWAERRRKVLERQTEKS